MLKLIANHFAFTDRRFLQFAVVPAFLGWFDELGKRISNTSQLTAQDQKLTAKWDRVYHTVNFEIEGSGSFEDDKLAEQKVEWGERPNVPGVVPSIGWQFIGWSGDVQQSVFSNSTFVARLELVKNKIYHQNTKESQNTNRQGNVVSDEIVFSPLSDLPDWHFDGWSPAMIANGQPQTPQIVVRDVERGVVLTADDYVLAYENNVEPGMGIARITGKWAYVKDGSVSELQDCGRVDEGGRWREVDAGDQREGGSAAFYPIGVGKGE